MNINLQAMMNKQFAVAKFYMNMSIIFSIIVLCLDIFIIFTGSFDKPLSLVIALLTILSPICSWKSTRLRDTAELILRRFEMYNGLGWRIDPTEMSDLLALAPDSVKKAAKSVSTDNSYFTNQIIQGPQKLLKNLEESAWWTKQQAIRMSRYTLYLSGIFFFAAVITLIIALQNNLSDTSANNVAKSIISMIVFVVSWGYIQKSFDYRLLFEEANKAERQAIQLGKSSTTIEEAINALHDYQIVRNTSPLLPSWLWKILQKELNELWKERNT